MGKERVARIAALMAWAFALQPLRGQDADQFTWKWTPGPPGLQQVTYGNGVFLAVGGTLWQAPAGVSATSRDGARWTTHTPAPSPIAGSVASVAPGNSNFVAVGNLGAYAGDPAATNGFIQFSPDGVNWDPPALVTQRMPLAAVVYGRGTYVAVGETNGVGAIVSSSDSVHWTSRELKYQGPLRGVAFGEGTFVAVGDSGAALTSANGTDWAPATVPTPDRIYAIAYGNGNFVATVQGTPQSYVGMMTSPDGTNWVGAAVHGAWPLAYGNGLFVGVAGVGLDGSTNGLRWSTVWWGFLGDVQPVAIAYGAGTFSVLVGGGGIFYIRPAPRLAWSGEGDAAANLTLTGGWLGMRGRLQASTNLSTTNWTDLFSFTNSGPAMPLQNAGATNYTRRFYRVAIP